MKKIILFFCLSICVQSCTSITSLGLKLAGAMNEEAKLTKLPVENKNIYYIGMVHLAKKDFYEDVSEKVDSLVQKGFFVYYEGGNHRYDSTLLKKRNENLTASDDTTFKKIRKLLRLNLNKSYSKNSFLKRSVEKHQLIDQPMYANLNVPKKRSESVDYSWEELLHFYEQAMGPVKLNECDFSTPIRSDYHCEKVTKEKLKYFSERILDEKRETLVIDSIINSNHDKILVLYGKGHLKGIKNKLK